MQPRLVARCHYVKNKDGNFCIVGWEAFNLTMKIVFAAHYSNHNKISQSVRQSVILEVRQWIFSTLSLHSLSDKRFVTCNFLCIVVHYYVVVICMLHFQKKRKVMAYTACTWVCAQRSKKLFPYILLDIMWNCT